MTPHTLLVAAADATQREFIAMQLDADGHTVHDTDSATGAIAKLSTQAIDVVLLADLARPADSPALLRSIRAGQHARVHPAQPAITLGDADELTTLRAYEAGSDHHLAVSSGYVVLRAVIDTIARRTLHQTTSRHLNIGDLHIDTAARTADISGTPVKTSRIEFELLCQLASDPERVFTKSQLMEAVWGYADPGRTRTVDSHAARLRAHLRAAGADGLVRNIWGTGYVLQAGRQLR